MRNNLLAAGAALALCIGVGTPAAADRFGDWDQNRDLYISEKEWDEGFTAEGVFDRWDRDGDGVLSREEFNSQLFRGFDLNRDRRLSLGEFGSFDDGRGERGIFRD